MRERNEYRQEEGEKVAEITKKSVKTKDKQDEEDEFGYPCFSVPPHTQSLRHTSLEYSVAPSTRADSLFQQLSGSRFCNNNPDLIKINFAVQEWIFRCRD